MRYVAQVTGFEPGDRRVDPLLFDAVDDAGLTSPWQAAAAYSLGLPPGEWTVLVARDEPGDREQGGMPRKVYPFRTTVYAESIN
jgi:hypothetical protein